MTSARRDGQMLDTARATIANRASHSSAAVVFACAVVEEISNDSHEIEEAEALRSRLEPVSL